MALGTRVTTRYANSKLVQLTNMGTASATTIDSTRFDAAVADVQGAFKMYAGVAYDDTDAQHIFVGAEGVITLLEIRSGVTPKPSWEPFRERLVALGRVTGRNRFAVTSNSDLSETTERQNGTRVTKNFDTQQFDDLVPEKPGAET